MATYNNANFEINLNLLDKYLKRRIDDIDRFRDFIRSNDFKNAKSIAHNMKGNGASFGFPEISSFGKELETCMADQDIVAAQILLFKLSDFVQAEYEKLQKRA